ncbi:MFS transporter [uncultured Williamsia sp.]|uniref:MFS transporter n=1 Tax=uncultured Williamsia sp. TaxID=259311 RepID=UPI0026306401|nr:MFS transporter [uncultured Williamsia sp.]
MSTAPPSQPAGPGVALASAQGRWVVAAAVLGSAIVMLDSTVVNVALPRIADDFDAGLASLQWTVTAYMTTLSALVLLGGSLGDRFGRRRVFIAGIVVFALASLACGLAPGIGVLIAARAVQGIGGAMLTPGSLAMIQSSLRPADRARAIGLWSGLGGVASAVGPFVGGALADGPGWRWVFLVNIPVAVACIAVAVRHVPETRDTQQHHGFDTLGAGAAIVALAATTVALIRAADGGTGLEVGLEAAVGLFAGLVFVRAERRAPEPMVPPHLFASRVFTVVNVMTFAIYAAIGGTLFLTALQLQVVAGYPAVWAGAALLPVTVLMLLLSARSAALAARIGPRIPLTVGACALAAGLFLFLRIDPDANYLTDVLPGALVMGVGLVTLVAPLTSTVLAAVDDAHSGLASGVNNAVARAAGLLAVAAIPLLAGTSAAGTLDASFDTTFRRAVPILAAVALVGGVIAWFGLRGREPDVAGDATTAPDTAGRLPRNDATDR